MPLIEVETEIDADLQTCFDLARDIDFYQESLREPTEIPVRGKISGKIEKGDYITWETNHLIFTQHLVLKVTDYISPSLFVDEMVKGDFKSYKHEHIFKKNNNKTVMKNRFYFESPMGVLGKVVDNVFLKRHMKKLLISRNIKLKEKAESL